MYSCSVMQHNSLKGRVRRAIVVSLAVAGLVPTVAVAWTPTTPQISVAVFGGTSSDIPNSVKVDGAGNIYTAGYFSGTVDFDPGAGTTNLTSAGGVESYVSKLNAAGDLLWAKSFGGTGTDLANSAAIDGSGNVYITGRFQATADFDPGAGTMNLTSLGGNDVFVSKLNAAGEFVWARSFGGTGNDEAYSVAVDGSGNVHTTGYFSDTADFDPGAGTVNVTSAGNFDAFVSKLNAAGDLVWAKTFGGADVDQPSSMTLDGSGNVYTTGRFSATADFDPGAGTSNLTATSADVFVSKLNTAGELVWAKAFGGSLSDSANSIAVDGSGNVYTTGYFYNSADFDPSAGTTSLTSAGGFDVFVSKLSASGALVWAKAFGGAGTEVGYSIALDGSGNLHTTGYFYNSADFDPGAGTTNMTSAGSSDVFISKLNATGGLVWAKTLGGTTTDDGYSVTVDASSNVYTAGRFGDTVDFDPGAGTANLTSAGSNDAFILKLDASGTATYTDTTPPSATWTPPSSPSSSLTLSYTLTFSEAVSGITSGDFRVLGSASGCVVTPSAASTQTSITVTVTCASDGTVSLELLQNSVLDGNSNTGPTTTASASQITINTPVVTTTTIATTTTAPATSTTVATSSTTTTTAAPSATTSTVVTQTGDAVTTNTTITTPSQSRPTNNTNATASTTVPTTTSISTTTSTTQPVLPDITVPETEVGGASALVGGVEIETRVTRENNELRVIAGSVSARIWATAKAGGKVPLDADGRLRLQVGDSVTVDVIGLDAATPVEVRLYSDPVLLGRTNVDASGTLGAAYEIPESVSDGNHTVVMVGTSNDDEVTLGLSIAVGDESAGIKFWVIAAPIGLAVLFAVILPVALRRRKKVSSS